MPQPAAPDPAFRRRPARFLTAHASPQTASCNGSGLPRHETGIIADISVFFGGATPLASAEHERQRRRAIAHRRCHCAVRSRCHRCHRPAAHSAAGLTGGCAAHRVALRSALPSPAGCPRIGGSWSGGVQWPPTGLSPCVGGGRGRPQGAVIAPTTLRPAQPPQVTALRSRRRWVGCRARTRVLRWSSGRALAGKPATGRPQPAIAASSEDAIVHRRR